MRALDFMSGDGNQAFISIPTLFQFNVVGALTQSYGGSTAIELGIASPGELGFGVAPWSHGVRSLTARVEVDDDTWTDSRRI